MIITPYSSLDTEAELPITAANFPALKHFFQCKETVGATSISDTIGGVVVPTAALTKPDANCISASGGTLTTSDVANISGSWAESNTKGTIVFAVGSFAAAGKIVIGNAATTGSGSNINLSGWSVVGPQISDGTTNIGPIAAVSDSSVNTFGIGVIINWAGNAYAFEAAAAGTAFSAKAGTSMGAVTTSGTYQDKSSMSGISKLYGLAVFEFTGALPTDIASAVTWMTAKWVVGEKVIYPGWKGLL